MKGPGLRSGSSRLAVGSGRLLVVVLALALIWYGAMVVLLALKFSPATVDAISGYRSAFDFLAGLTAGDITPAVRAITAGAGVLCLMVFGVVAYRALPRPYRTRSPLKLGEGGGPGDVRVNPRAIERLAEHAAREHPGVSSASGRFATDAVTVGVGVHRPGELAELLPDVQRRVRNQLERHDLPALRVDVTLTGVDSVPRREIR